MPIHTCIETRRLILKTVTLDDVDAVACSWNLSGPPLTREEAQQQVTRMMENHLRSEPPKIYHLCLAILQKETQEIIGWCGLDHRDPQWANPALFYLIKKSCWGMGYATEAAKALLGYAFRDLRIHKVDAACAADNIASKRVMEKIGMRYLGLDAEGGYRFTMDGECTFYF